MDMRKVVLDNPLLAIMRNVPVDKTIDYAEAIVGGGCKFFEVAMNSPAACEQIRMLRDHFTDDVFIGAGTAVTVELAKAAVSAGAQFLLTPSTDSEVVLYCEENKIPLIPGVMTPTDVSFCLQHGFKTLKMFPAGDLPSTYVKSLKGPLDGAEFIAIGGVTADNIADFFKNGYIGVGLGSAILPKKYVEENRWDEGRAYVADLIRRVKEAGK